MPASWTDIYVTVAGDMWDMIAYRIYGAEKFMAELMAANPDRAGIGVFNGGVELVAPEIAVSAASSLPPWKR